MFGYEPKGRGFESLTACQGDIYIPFVYLAGVMELADVTDSKSVGSDTVWVRVPPPAP